MDLRFWKGVVTAVLGSAAALVGLAAMLAWFLRRQKRKRLVTHLLRLASDVVDVAESIDQDLEGLPRVRTLAALLSRSRESRERAEAFLAQGQRLDWLPVVRIARALELLHDEHRRIVDLRSEVDTALAAWRHGPRADAGRTRTFGFAAKESGSRWPSSGFCTRPSTLV